MIKFAHACHRNKKTSKVGKVLPHAPRPSLENTELTSLDLRSKSPLSVLSSNNGDLRQLLQNKYRFNASLQSLLSYSLFLVLDSTYNIEKKY